MNKLKTVLSMYVAKYPYLAAIDVCLATLFAWWVIDVFVLY
jgi:hypothetical protein